MADRSITTPGSKSRAGQKDSVTNMTMVQRVLMTMILTGQSENLYSMSLFKNTVVGWVKDRGSHSFLMLQGFKSKQVCLSSLQFPSQTTTSLEPPGLMPTLHLCLGVERTHPTVCVIFRSEEARTLPSQSNDNA